MNKKKVFLISAMVVTLGLSQVANSQINLEKTFNESVSWNGSIHIEQDAYPANTYYSAGVVGNSYVVKVYNADYSLRTNNTYNFTPPAGYKVSSVSMSRKIFNTDDNYEFMVNYVRTDNTLDNTREKVILHNQNGTIIKDFGSAYMVSVYPYPHIANNRFRLIVTKYYYNGSLSDPQIEIYSLPGTPPVSTMSVKADEYQSSPYPNPANAVITLPYQLAAGETSVMNIYSINGQLIERKQIDSVFDKILLNVSNYAKGMYIYEVKGVSNRFVVE